MKNILFLASFLLLSILVSCNTINRNNTQNNDSTILKENELLKKELAIKQKELELEVKQREVASQVKNGTPISQLYKHVKQGVFLVYAFGNSSTSQGSGFFINSSGVAISNFHVFKNAINGVIYLDTGQEFMITKIIAYDEVQDYVIFKVGIDKSDFYPLPISTKLSEIGEPCFAIGNPEGLAQTLSIGNISGYREVNGMSYIQTTAEITHGSSGGPLFNEQGEVIGITTMGKSEANLNFAININEIPWSVYATSISEKAHTDIIPTESIKKVVNNYYSTLASRDYSNLRNFYTSVLDRYYTEFNITSESAVNNAMTYWTKFKIVSVRNIINWNTFYATTLSDGCINVIFSMDYFIEREERTKAKKFALDINILFTPELRIKSIYENIVSSRK